MKLGITTIILGLHICANLFASTVTLENPVSRKKFKTQVINHQVKLGDIELLKDGRAFVSSSIDLKRFCNDSRDILDMGGKAIIPAEIEWGTSAPEVRLQLLLDSSDQKQMLAKVNAKSILQKVRLLHISLGSSYDSSSILSNHISPDLKQLVLEDWNANLFTAIEKGLEDGALKFKTKYFPAVCDLINKDFTAKINAKYFIKNESSSVQLVKEQSLENFYEEVLRNSTNLNSSDLNCEQKKIVLSGIAANAFYQTTSHKTKDYDHSRFLKLVDAFFEKGDCTVSAYDSGTLNKLKAIFSINGSSVDEQYIDYKIKEINL